jgi:phospholipase/carboxylesterase
VLLLTFHGMGGDERQFHGLAQRLLPRAHVVSPRGGVWEEGVGNRYFRRAGMGRYDMADLGRRTDEMADLIAAERARTGAARTLAFGFSNGANILASVLMSRPEAVDAAALLHPLMPFEPPAQPGLAGTAILLTAGRADPICPAPETERLLAWFRGQGAAVEEVWHPGGHGIEPVEVEALARFLVAHSAEKAHSVT